MISQIQLKSIEQYQNKRSEILSAYPCSLGLSDSAIYFYMKQATFLSKKQQRSKLFFFQGLNTYPQNLSIFLRDQSAFQTAVNHSKQKLVKGIFNVYNFYSKNDCVIQISIPGNMKIYKIINNKKQNISNEQIDLMYVSSVLRTIYQKNLMWGRYYGIFKNQTDQLAQFTNFLIVLLKISLKNQIYINDQFESTCLIKGSHSFSLLLKFIIEKRIANHCIQIVKKQMKSNSEYSKSPKINLLMAQLYNIEGKFSKCIQYTSYLARQFSNDPYILYNKAKYLMKLLMIQQALKLLNSIVHYNQFEIWCLLSQIYIHKKNFKQALICLNHAAKNSKYRNSKNIQIFWQPFQQLGKVRIVSGNDPMHFHPKINIKSQSPLSIPVKLVPQKHKTILEHTSWKLNKKQLMIYRYIQKIFYCMETKKFNLLLEQTFISSNSQITQVMFKKGLTQSMFIDFNNQNKDLIIEPKKQDNKVNRKPFSSQNNLEQLPTFLQEKQDHFQMSIINQNSRNLSIIPQLQSMIENSNYQQQQKIQNRPINTKRTHFNKRQMSEQIFKILNVVFSDGQFQKILCLQNYPQILKVYNQLKRSAFSNNYFATQMFKILSQKGQYKVIIVLLAEILDFIQSKGIKKIRKLPYWLQGWIFFIITQKGLSFLNKTLMDLKFQDQAVLDTIQLAHKWKISGIKN